MIVDSYRFLPKSFIPLFDTASPAEGDDQPVWACSSKRLASSRIALLTSAGLHVEGQQEPFDAEGERRNPGWGDPSFRTLPQTLSGVPYGMTHLHVNPTDILADHNIALPSDRLADLVGDGVVGGSTPHHYSVMGYQEAGLRVWRNETAPAIISRLRDEGADGVVLAPV